MFLLRYPVWLLTRASVSLRYRVKIQGIEQVRGIKGPVLILPNHPAYMDPVLALVALWPSLRPRPLQYEGYFRNPLLYRRFPPASQAIRRSPATCLSLTASQDIPHPRLRFASPLAEGQPATCASTPATPKHYFRKSSPNSM